MAGKKYSLANYILSINLPSELENDFGSSSIQIGGEGSFLESITITLNSNLWETNGDATGSWVHTKNLNRTGNVTINLNQMSDAVYRFKQLCNIYYNLSTEQDGLTMTLRDMNSKTICTCEDCVIQKIPDQVFQDSPQSQSWQFNCGKITYLN